ncbi:MAG: c-type cytochrome [Gallionella sp.]
MLITPAIVIADELIEAQEQGDPAQGKQRVQSENCQECHGLSGAGLSPAAPKLAGQYANYLVKQLQDFQSGVRKHPVMNIMAESLNDQDQADIAAWFAGNKAMSGNGSLPSLIARDIFSRGDNSRNILPCKSCHGETGQGRYSETGSYPVIGGQYRVYLREQLRNWRSGARANSPGGIMNVIARFLSDDEIEALAGYVSGL